MRHARTRYQFSQKQKKAALALIIPICLLSVLLALLFVSVLNDIYAFIKPEGKITVSVTQPLTDRQLASLLQERGVIKNDLAFTAYLRSKDKSDTVSLIFGEWTLDSNMSYRQILSAILYLNE